MSFLFRGGGGGLRKKKSEKFKYYLNATADTHTHKTNKNTRVKINFPLATNLPTSWPGRILKVTLKAVLFKENHCGD